MGVREGSTKGFAYGFAKYYNYSLLSKFVFQIFFSESQCEKKGLNSFIMH